MVSFYEHRAHPAQRRPSLAILLIVTPSSRCGSVEAYLPVRQPYPTRIAQLILKHLTGTVDHHYLVLRECHNASTKVSAVMLVILAVIVFSWRRWSQRKQAPLVTEEQAHAVVSLHATERAVEYLEQGRAAATPTAEVVRAAGHEERGAMANLHLNTKEEKNADLEMGSTAEPLNAASKENHCQTETQGKATTESDQEEASWGEGAAQLTVKEAPALNCTRGDRLNSDEGACAAQKEQHNIDQHCAEAVSGLVAEEQRTEDGVDVSKICLDEQQREVMSACGVVHEVTSRHIGQQVCSFCSLAHAHTTVILVSQKWINRSSP